MSVKQQSINDTKEFPFTIVKSAKDKSEKEK